MITIVADVSDLGLGHLAQVASVLGHLRTVRPNTAMVLRTRRSRSQVEAFLGFEVSIVPPPRDAIIVTSGANTYCLPETAESFISLHRQWDQAIEHEAERLAVLHPSFLLSNISYLSIAAARRAGLPCFAFSSINWLEFFRAYFAPLPQARAIIRDMRDAYNSADLFVRPSPHVPMTGLRTVATVGPVARIGLNRRRELQAFLGAPSSKKLALVTFGGIPLQAPARLPEDPKIHWIVQGLPHAPRPDITPTSALPFKFIDVLASVDVVVGKDSYGVVSEAVCNAVRLIVLPRSASIEATSLISWAKAHGVFAVAEGGVEQPSFLQTVKDVISLPDPIPIPPFGAAQTVDLLMKRLRIAG